MIISTPTGVMAMIEFLNQYSSAMQALNAIAIIVLTFILVGVTWWQSLTAKKAFLIVTQQFALEWYPELYAEAVFVASYPDACEITNLGRSTALLLSLTLSSQSAEKSASIERPHKRVVRSGESVIVPITRELRAYLEKLEVVHTRAGRYDSAKERIAISFSFYSAGTIRRSKSFALTLGKGGHIERED
ncbi:MAG: hypothetical protein ACLQMT_11815 [Candidatus Acidiferrales bacterium]